MLEKGSIISHDVEAATGPNCTTEERQLSGFGVKVCRKVGGTFTRRASHFTYMRLIKEFSVCINCLETVADRCRGVRGVSRVGIGLVGEIRWKLDCALRTPERWTSRRLEQPFRRAERSRHRQ